MTTPSDEMPTFAELMRLAPLPYSREDTFLHELERLYHQNRTFPTLSEFEALGFNEAEIVEFLNKPSCRKKIEALGIKAPPAPGTSAKLTPRQLMAVQILFDFHDNRSDKKKLADLGISTQTYQGWLKDPSFQEFIQARAQQLIPLNIPDIERALLDKARAGDLAAIKFIYEKSGIYNASENAMRLQAELYRQQNAFDVQSFMLRVIEVLQIHLSAAPETLKAIATDLKALSPSSQNSSLAIEPVKITSTRREL